MISRRPMREALRAAYAGIRANQGGPFGACLTRGAKILASAHNTVLKTNNPTCHAEMNAIRAASRKLKTFDLSGCAIYSTTEPCPMCFAAIHWAKIDLVIYGTSIADVKKRGFNELRISNAQMKKWGKSPVRIRKLFMLKECRELLSAWDKKADKRVY